MRIWFFISILFVGCIFSTSYPICDSKEDIVIYAGQTVRLSGVYKYVDYGKCWVSEIVLTDDTIVILNYEPQSSEVEKFKDRAVVVTGIILSSFPETTYDQQWIVAPHIVNVTSIEEVP